MKQADYLIVGQGITGSVLALTLMKRGKEVTVVDVPQLSSSSKVAGGVFNPFNFRFMMNLWRGREMLEAGSVIYRYAEEISGNKLFHKKKLLKILTEAERKLWEEACMMKDGLFADEKIVDDIPSGIDAPFGCGLVKETGFIDCGMLMHMVSEKLSEDGNFIAEKFHHELLEIKDDSVVYDQRISADRIIFCEGHLARINPVFQHINLQPTKGQLLHVSIPGLSQEFIYSRGVSLLPMGNERFILSGTYENGIDNELTDQDAEDELIDKVRKFVSKDIRVESRFAGVRPFSPDRKAIVGMLESNKRVGILNGMGSRAVLQAPFMAKMLVEHAEDGKQIPREISVNRFI